MTVLPLLANLTMAAGGIGARALFERALRDPDRAQSRILRRIVSSNAGSRYGRTHGFDQITSSRDYVERVPLVDYDTIAPWVERAAAGEPAVLTAAPLQFMEPTGGSSGIVKLVPYTRALLNDFSAATMPWLSDLLFRRPALACGRAYWSITPPARRESRTAGGIPIGMRDDADYFPAPLRTLIRSSLAVPALVSLAPDVATCRYLTLRALLAAPDLTFISVWNPSFLTLLAAALDEQWPSLLDDLERGGIAAGVAVGVGPALATRLRSAFPPVPDLARSLRRRFGTRPPEDLGLVWRQLALISCWADASAARALGGMTRRFPSVEVQGKGLLATEGVVSIPFGDGAPVAAVTSHFLEFLDPRDGRSYGAAELDIGGSYEVALTTSGGLYRYRLRDLVRVDGKLHRAPRLTFIGRADRASDIAGEKLTDSLVEHALGAAARATGISATFAMLAPAWTPVPHYRLYVEATPARAAGLALALDRELRGAHHYALCRALGQLGPIHAVSVRGGERIYERACAERGQRAGAVKPPTLEPTPGWERFFEHDQTSLPA